jgi:hypothetical protein
LPAVIVLAARTSDCRQHDAGASGIVQTRVGETRHCSTAPPVVTSLRYKDNSLRTLASVNFSQSFAWILLGLRDFRQEAGGNTNHVSGGSAQSQYPTPWSLIKHVGFDLAKFALTQVTHWQPETQQ